MAFRQRDENKLRTLLAQECARIMSEEGVKDFLVAKRKAAGRLGITGKALMPSNKEIEQSRWQYQRLFQAEKQTLQLRTLRAAAIEAMEFFARFRPRLVGPVLSGIAGLHSEVNLHVFADTPEEIILFLMEKHIPLEPSERRLRLCNGEYAYFPVLAFEAGEVGIDLTIFPVQSEREAPRSPVDGQPMRRADLDTVQTLLEET